MTILTKIGAAALALALAAGAAQAAPTWSVQTYAEATGQAFNASLPLPSSFTNVGGTALRATFTYTGDLWFSHTQAQNSGNTGDLNSAFYGANVAGISNFQNLGPAATTNAAWGANWSTFANYLASSGSASGYKWGTAYIFTTMLNTAGGSLTIRHDDGASVYVDNVLVPGTISSPTTVVTETIALPAGSELKIVYARENGTPSVLQVTIPEPMSLALLGAGLLGLAAVRRRRAA